MENDKARFEAALIESGLQSGDRMYTQFGSTVHVHTFKNVAHDGFYYESACGRFTQYSSIVKLAELEKGLALTSHFCKKCLPNQSAVDISIL
jgi:hypothetical protein